MPRTAQARHRRLCPRTLIACWLAATGLLAPPAIAQPISQRAGEPYQRALALVERGGEWERFDFARIALDAMITEHEQALQRSGSAVQRSGTALPHSGTEAPETTGRQTTKLRRWRAATMPYLNTLYDALHAAELAEEVEVVVGGEGTVQLLVGPHNVVVSPMDIRHPGALEDAIVAEFCQLHDCGFSPDLEAAGGRWVFSSALSNQSGQAGYATTTGVRCLFAGAGQRGTKERACRELGHALATLSTRLRRSQGAGIPVVPEAFAVQREGPGTLSLRMNDVGDWLMVDDPGLAVVPDVLELALPWLADRLRPHADSGFAASTELVIPHAEVLLAALLSR